MVGAYNYEDYELFSVSDDGNLQYKNRPLSLEQIQESVTVLEKHRSKFVDSFYGDLVSSGCPERLERASLEAMIFAIANQGVTFETGCSTFNWYKKLCQGDLLKLKEGGSYSSEDSFTHLVFENEENRYKPFLDFLDENYGGRADILAKSYFMYPDETRDKLVQVKGIAAKTASFYSLMMGIKSHMTLDIHNYRFLHQLGIDMPKRCYLGRRFEYEIGKEKKNAPPAEIPLFDGEDLPVTTPPIKFGSKQVGDQPSFNQYKAIEKETKRLIGPTLRCYPQFITENGDIDYSLLTALLWTTGAKISRSKNTHLVQLDFGDNEEDPWEFHDSSDMFDKIEAVWSTK